MQLGQAVRPPVPDRRAMAQEQRLPRGEAAKGAAPETATGTLEVATAAGPIGAAPSQITTAGLPTAGDVGVSMGARHLPWQ